METASWTTIHDHETGDFTCDFDGKYQVCFVKKLATAYKIKDGERIDSFSVSDMRIEDFHAILVEISKLV